jgi:hypothetical protein
MLITLLRSPPSYAISLDALKSALGGAGAGGATKVVYGAVAKRLVKIERGGGEQIVKFNV